MSSDLHLHTKFSDGLLSPTELVEQAVNVGLAIISITDHDSTDGIIEALTATDLYPQITLIPGVELSTDFEGGEIHILGYFNEIPEGIFQDKMAEFRQSRVGRARDMIGNLAGLGMELDWQRVQELAADGSIGRPHVALALQEKGYVETVSEAFDKYIGMTGPAYVDRQKLAPDEAITLIKNAGGVAVLAHPLNKEIDLRNIDTGHLAKLVTDLAQAGLTGIETYYGSYTPAARKHLAGLAEENQLLSLGGSDFHGPGIGADVPLGASDTSVECGKDLLRALDELWNMFEDE